MKIQKRWGLPVLIAVVVLILPALAGAYPAEVPRTGQTTCYADNGTVIDCAGTGQDGEYQTGVVWPSPRFLDNGDTVTDKLTGLEWTKDANPAGGYMTWQDALDYVKTLNTGGHSDWRLPNVDELESLVNAELCGPALPQNYPFTNVVQSYYWSSTTYAGNSLGVWLVDLFDGRVNIYGKTNDGYSYVWPVRFGQCGSICMPKTGQTTCYADNGTKIDCTDTGQDGDIQAGVAWPDPRFVDYGDGTVTDKLTGLMWTKDANLGGLKNWQDALEYVKTLNTGGHSDWRLPNRQELCSLVDYSQYPALPSGNPFTNVQSYYWSSTSYASVAYNAWVVDIVHGFVYGPQNKIFGTNVWPVRACQSWSFDNLIIAQTPMSGPPGTTFAQWGTGGTPNGMATLHFRKPDGSEYPTQPQQLDSIGHFDITYVAPLDKPAGQYTWWAIDNATRYKSNEVTYEITSTSLDSLIISEYYPEDGKVTVGKGSVAVLHYTVTPSGQHTPLAGQYATVEIDGATYTTPWKKTSTSDVGGLDNLVAYAGSSTLWVAVDTKALSLSPGTYTGRITKIGDQTLQSPKTFKVTVLEESGQECNLGNGLGAEVSFGDQIGAGIDSLVEAEAGAAVFAGGADLLYLRVPSLKNTYLERHISLDIGGKLYVDIGKGIIDVGNVGVKRGMKPFFVKKYRYDLTESGISSKALFTAELLDHFFLYTPAVRFAVMALKTKSSLDYSYEYDLGTEWYLSGGGSLSPSINISGPKDEERKIDTTIYGLETKATFEIGAGWDYDKNEDWVDARIGAGLENGGMFSFNASMYALGLYYYNKDGQFSRYEIETKTNQDFSTFWKFYGNASSVNFPVKSSSVSLKPPTALISDLSTELFSTCRCIEYERQYEKEAVIPIGLSLNYGFGLHLSTSFESMTSAVVEKGQYCSDSCESGYAGRYFPTELSPDPTSPNCGIDEITDNVLKPAISAVENEIFKIMEATGQTVVEFINSSANSVAKIQSSTPINILVSMWSGTWQAQSQQNKMYNKLSLMRPGIAMQSLAVMSFEGSLYGVGGFFNFQPEDVVLNEPMTITIQYDPADLGVYLEDTLRAYRWDVTTQQWKHIGGTVDTAAHTVTFQTTRYGTYTLSPRIPNDEQFPMTATPSSLPSDNTSLCTLTSDTIYNNDGTVIADGTLFTVRTQNAGALGDVACGTVTSTDEDAATEGIQVSASGGKITFTVKAPDNECLAYATAESIVGGAWGKAQIDFAGGLLKRLDPVAIIRQPGLRIATVGENIIFEIVTAGTEPKQYQWRRGASDLSGEIGSALTLNNVQLTDSDNYSVLVYNAFSNETSEPIVLTVELSTATTTSIVPTTTTAVSSTTTTSVATTSTTTALPTTTSTASTTTTTVSSRPCPAKKALGEDNPNLENLRVFRDSKLANSAVGRKVIQIYYNNADSINAALERSPALRAFTKKVLEVIAPMVVR